MRPAIVWSQVITRLPLITAIPRTLLSLPSALNALIVALNAPSVELAPEITPELLIVNPVGNPLAVQLVGLRVAGTCMLTFVPVSIDMYFVAIISKPLNYEKVARCSTWSYHDLNIILTVR